MTASVAASGAAKSRSTAPVLCYKVEALPSINKGFYQALADSSDHQLVQELTIPPRCDHARIAPGTPARSRLRL
jgi:hypothetical protein